jgi:pimeloyl-ACP methyl ester carboxylesterase
MNQAGGSGWPAVGSVPAMENPTLLVHGLGTSAARTWGDNGWIDLLRDTGRTVVAPDLLGHGRSARPHDPGAYDGLEADIARQLDEAVGPDTVVDAIGFSLGARTLLHLACARPDRFGHLVLAGVGANLFRRDGTGGPGLAGVMLAPHAPESPALAYFHRLAHSDGNDPEAFAALLTRPGGPRLSDEGLAGITCPVLVVLGEQDFVGPADPLVARLTGAAVKVQMLPRTDHAATPKNFTFIDTALAFIGAGP